MKRKTNNFGTICICAVRYAIGRMSYMPSLVQDYVLEHLDKLNPFHLRVMIRDINEADNISVYTLSDGTEQTLDGLGDTEIDRPGWIRFRGALEEELRKRDEER